MARRQVAILSINRGVTTLNGMVVERASGEDPYQAGIRAVTEQIAAPSRRKVQVVATDDASRIRMYVHPDGEVSDIETLEVFEPAAAPDSSQPGAAWVAVPPRQLDPEPVSEPGGSAADDVRGSADEPAEARDVAAEADEDVPEREQTAERPPIRAPLSVPEPDPPADVPSSAGSEASPEAAAEPAAVAEPEDEVPEREQTAERPAIREPLAVPDEPAEPAGPAGHDGVPENEPDVADETDPEAEREQAAPPVVPLVIRKPPFGPPPASVEPIDDAEPDPEPEEAPAAAMPSAPAYSDGAPETEPLPAVAPPAPLPAPEAVEPPERVGPLVRVGGAAPAGGGAEYKRPPSRLTGRGRVVVVVAIVVLLLLIYAAFRSVSSRTSPASTAHPGQSPTPSTPAATVPPTTLTPTPTATPTTPASTPTTTPTSAPTRPAPVQYTRTLTVKAVSETEAIELVITASRLPVTATIRMDPWGAPEPFTTTVRLTEPGQKVMIKPVASGHAKWSVRVDGARKVTGYTHSWPKGKRTFVKR